MTPTEKKKLGVYALSFIMGGLVISTAISLTKTSAHNNEVAQVITELDDETNTRELLLTESGLVVMNINHNLVEATIGLDVQKIFPKEHRVSNRQFSTLVKDHKGMLVLVSVNGGEVKTKEITVLSNAKAVDLDGKYIYVLEPDKVTKFDYNGEVINQTKLNMSYQEILGYNNKIYLLDKKILQELGGLQISLGGNLQQVYKQENMGYIINDFGKGKGNWMLVVLDLDTLKVSNITAIESNTQIRAVLDDSIELQKGENVYLINKVTLKSM